MLDSIYHMTLKLIKNHIFGMKRSYIMIPYNGLHYAMLRNLQTTSGLPILLHGVISLPDATSDHTILCSH